VISFLAEGWRGLQTPPFLNLLLGPFNPCRASPSSPLPGKTLNGLAKAESPRNRRADTRNGKKEKEKAKEKSTGSSTEHTRTVSLSLSLSLSRCNPALEIILSRETPIDRGRVLSAKREHRDRVERREGMGKREGRER